MKSLEASSFDAIWMFLSIFKFVFLEVIKWLFRATTTVSFSWFIVNYALNISSNRPLASCNLKPKWILLLSEILGLGLGPYWQHWRSWCDSGWASFSSSSSEKNPGRFSFWVFFLQCINVQTSYFHGFHHQGKTCKIHNQPHCRLQVVCDQIFRDSEGSHEILEFGSLKFIVWSLLGFITSPTGSQWKSALWKGCAMNSWKK